MMTLISSIKIEEIVINHVRFLPPPHSHLVSGDHAAISVLHCSDRSCGAFILTTLSAMKMQYNKEIYISISTLTLTIRKALIEYRSLLLFIYYFLQYTLSLFFFIQSKLLYIMCVLVSPGT